MSQKKIDRLAEIQEQVKALIKEGEQIAEETNTMFWLNETPLANEYGMGGLVYVPPGLNVDRWGDPIEENDWRYGNSSGWQSSASDEC